MPLISNWLVFMGTYIMDAFVSRYHSIYIACAFSAPIHSPISRLNEDLGNQKLYQMTRKSSVSFLFSRLKYKIPTNHIAWNREKLSVMTGT